MKRRKTSLNVNELFPIPGRRPKKEWGKVKDEKGRPGRGLWQRKGAFYAQLRPFGKSEHYKYRLEHARTVPQAITAMQVLKDSQQKGTHLPPGYQAVIILVLAVTAVLVVKRLALVSVQKARRYLEEGALVVDVRNPDEFSQRHVPGAINFPLSGLPENLGTCVSDKRQELLLHCQGGGRSALAKRVLRANGYVRANNLGSYRRAGRIVGARE